MVAGDNCSFHKRKQKRSGMPGYESRNEATVGARGTGIHGTGSRILGHALSRRCTDRTCSERHKIRDAKRNSKPGAEFSGGEANGSEG
jgi:hypothetical protein